MQVFYQRTFQELSDSIIHLINLLPVSPTWEYYTKSCLWLIGSQQKHPYNKYKLLGEPQS